MASLSLDEVLKNISKKYGDEVVKREVEALESDGVLSLGSPTIDYCLYGK